MVIVNFANGDKSGGLIASGEKMSDNAIYTHKPSPNDLKSKSGRLPELGYVKWLTSMKTTAWYSYIVASGIDFRKIPLKYYKENDELDGLPPSLIKDKNRHWRRWSDGECGVSKINLLEVEKVIPGSFKTYTLGPEGKHIWVALSPDAPIESQLELHRFGYPDPHELFHMLHTNAIDSGSLPKNTGLTYEEIAFSGTKLDTTNAWNTIYLALLYYLLRESYAQQFESKLPTDTPNLEHEQLQSRINAEKYLLDTLFKHDETLSKYGLCAQDFVYLLFPLRCPVSNIEDFKSRRTESFWTNLSDRQLSNLYDPFGFIDYNDE